MTEKSGLYIHVPFCFSQCSYCDFYKKKAERVEDGYVGLVLKRLHYTKKRKRSLSTPFTSAEERLRSSNPLSSAGCPRVSARCSKSEKDQRSPSRPTPKP